jgi:hypothetical protein
MEKNPLKVKYNKYLNYKLVREKVCQYILKLNKI